MRFVVEMPGNRGLKLEKHVSEEPAEVLTADIIKELSHMASWELDAIYHHGRRKVTIEQTPEAYKALRKMASWQLKAIFGD